MKNNDARFTTLIKTDEILSTKENVITKISELEGMLDYVQNFMKKSKEYFDTETADYFREIVDRYINKEKDVLNMDLLNYVKSLDKICKAYDTLNTILGKEVRN